MLQTAATLLLAITNVTLIDGTNDPPKPNQTVIIRAGRITDIGESLRVPPGAVTINGTGKFLIPGLWDMHVHVLTNPTANFPKLLAKGITGVRNMHVQGPDPLATAVRLRKAVEQQTIVGPHIVANGPIVDGPSPTYAASLRAFDAASATAIVQALKQGGADFLKVYDFVPPEAYEVLLKEANRLRLPVDGHIPLGVTPQEAVEAGQRSAEHLSGVFQTCTAKPNVAMELRNAVIFWSVNRQQSAQLLHSIVLAASAEYDENKCRPLFQLFVDKGVWQCPTLGALRDFQPVALRVVRQMHQQGVRLLAGTDGGSDGVEPGETLHRELELLVEAGLSPLAALQAPTINPAEFLGRTKDFGAIAKGKVADLVLLEADPLQDIRNIRRIATVILRGRQLPKR